MDRCEVEFQPLGRRSDAAVGSTVFDAARDAGVSIASGCGGSGTCGRCRIEVLSGQVSQPDLDELHVLARNRASGGERLACRITLCGLEEILPLAVEYGCELIALALDEGCIPKTADNRLDVIRRMVNRTRE